MNKKTADEMGKLVGDVLAETKEYKMIRDMSYSLYIKDMESYRKQKSELADYLLSTTHERKLMFVGILMLLGTPKELVSNMMTDLLGEDTVTGYSNEKAS